MRRLLWFVLIASTAFAADDALRLPVRRVVLYKSGVGYFEHVGRVHGSQDVSIDFTTSQLNDVLKSLTVIDTGHGHVTAVNYNSNAPFSKRLSTLRLPLGEQTTVAQFLGAMRGARVEVRSGQAVVLGNLLSVEHRQRMEREQTAEYDTVSLVTDGGEIRTFELSPSTALRIVDRDLNEDVGRYLRVLSSAREQDLRRMTIAASGSGDRDLAISYISEVPVWKSTYRIVLPDLGGKALLQGWAIIDNTVGEDWNNVELSLVAGAPQSFIEDISQPYYARRPVVTLPQAAMLTPQTHEATMEQNMGGAAQISSSRQFDRIDSFGRTPLSPPSAGATDRFVGGGVGSGSRGGLAPGWGGAAGGTIGKLRTNNGTVPAMEPQAQAADLGDLFEYRIKQPVTILKNQSALVPIMQAQIEAEKVSLWSSNRRFPLRALWITNSSGLTLDGGTFNIIESDAFAGEGLLDPIKPGERRLVSYAADQGVRIEYRPANTAPRVVRVSIVRGLLTQTSREQQESIYALRNEGNEPRTVVVEHPVRSDWQLQGDTPKPAETTASFYRFRIVVPAKQTAKLSVKEVHPLSQVVELASFTDDNLKHLTSQQIISPQLEKSLRQILERKAELAQIQNDIDLQKQRLSDIVDDQKRLRENMKALRGSAEEKALVVRYTRELNEQEDRVATLRRAVADLQQKAAQIQSDINHLIEQLSTADDSTVRAEATM